MNRIRTALSGGLGAGLGTKLAACTALLALATTAACSGGAIEDDADASPASEREETFSPTRYVALGDSFTAAPFVPNSVDANGCYRSTVNYPALVAAAFPDAESVDVSCSGAQTKDLTTRQTTATGQQVPPQFKALTPETDLVTVGIGGNDFDLFQTMITRCPELAATDPDGAPCREDMNRSGEDALKADVGRIQSRVRAILDQVREQSPDARVLLVSYPQIVPENGDCTDLPLAGGDYAYTREVSDHLDRALRTAAERGGAELVDLWSASEGHDVCADEPWVNGATTDFSRALEYHPFAEGQAAVAELVLELLAD